MLPSIMYVSLKSVSEIKVTAGKTRPGTAEDGGRRAARDDAVPGVSRVSATSRHLVCEWPRHLPRLQASGQHLPDLPGELLPHQSHPAASAA